MDGNWGAEKPKLLNIGLELPTDMFVKININWRATCDVSPHGSRHFDRCVMSPVGNVQGPGFNESVVIRPTTN